MKFPPELVYIAGPISAPTEAEREANIRNAEHVYRELIQIGIAAVCVHSTARRLWGRVSEEAALAADLVLLARCDAVLLTPGWQTSRGTAIEIAHAAELGIPVYERLAELLAAARQPAQDGPESQIASQLAVG